MKFKFILFSVLAGVLIIAIYFSLKLGEVSGIYQNISYEERWGSECKSTIVLVENYPIMKENLVKLWERERESFESVGTS